MAENVEEIKDTVEIAGQNLIEVFKEPATVFSILTLSQVISAMVIDKEKGTEIFSQDDFYTSLIKGMLKGTDHPEIENQLQGILNKIEEDSILTEEDKIELDKINEMLKEGN